MHSFGSSIVLSWNSNLQPCVASGGIPGDGWAGAKTSSRGIQSVPLTQLGAFTYSMTCGSGTRQATESTQVEVRPPFATLEALSNNMRVGSEVILMQTGGGTSCTRSGGAPDDVWASSAGVLSVPRQNTRARHL